MRGKENKRSLQDEMSIEIWRVLYKERFGFRFDFSKITLPPVKDNHALPIIMSPQLMRGKVGFINRIFNVCKESFPCWSFCKDLGAAIVRNDRSPDRPYAIRAGSHLEATDGDSDLKDSSANVIRERGLPTLALPERLMQELYIWYTLGRHLDVRDATLCAGSCDSFDSVPDVGWNDDELGVGCYDPDSHGGNRRARAAVL